jgi:hypothetical protein
MYRDDKWLWLEVIILLGMLLIAILLGQYLNGHI